MSLSYDLLTLIAELADGAARAATTMDGADQDLELASQESDPSELVRSWERIGTAELKLQDLIGKLRREASRIEQNLSEQSAALCDEWLDDVQRARLRQK